ncbi:MAG: hypothetical protein Unbinned6437contig1000_60 [Prokaryotic dsDNA virus sp.]|nr:MAG: hypothetical protein Unbinned6437contig1000_60 [Prokaryotic dsDNA virus sp.]|tara:strand:- start:10028 stop:10219 length:192 start_codon:yes stop_codon:yes gene_type:complete
MNICKIKFISGGKMRITAKTEFLAMRHASQYGTVASCEEAASRWWHLIWVVLIVLGFYAGQML